MQLRESPSGPFTRGSITGEVLSWNAVSERWEPSLVDSLLPGAPIYDIRDFGAFGNKGIGTTDTVVGAPAADLAAAGLGAGYYVGCRVSAVDVLRLTFQGTLAGGAVNFNFVKVNP
jgi:hypothetical protein